MALVLLEGTSAAFDFTSGLRTSFGGTPATAVSWKNVASYLSLDLGREMFPQTTFNNSGWSARIGGQKSAAGRLAMIASKGLAISDPLYLMANNFPWACVCTIDTGCTLSFDAVQSNRHIGIQAAGNSEDGIAFESYNAVTSAWVVT